MKKICMFFVIVMVLTGCITGCAASTDKTSYTYKQIDSQYQFKQIHMCDVYKGWAITTENEILFTDNGIENFVSIKKFGEINSATEGFLNAAFLDEQTAYVTYFSPDTIHLIVEYTDDAGKNWSQTLVQYDKFADICDAGSAYISFADKENGYLLYCSTPAAGMMTKLLFSTTDGGKNYSFVSDLTNEITGYPQGISFNSRDNGYITVSYRGLENNYLYTTMDGGGTWNSEKVILQDEKVNYIDGSNPPVFYGENKQKGILVLKLVGENEEYGLFSTADSGNHWTQEEKLSLESIVGYSAIGENQLFFIDSTGRLIYLYI